MTAGEPSETEIVQMLEPRFGSKASAYDWYKSVQLPGFGRATANDLMRAGRAQEMVEYLDAVDRGLHA